MIGVAIALIVVGALMFAIGWMLNTQTPVQQPLPAIGCIIAFAGLLLQWAGSARAEMRRPDVPGHSAKQVDDLYRKCMIANPANPAREKVWDSSDPACVDNLKSQERDMPAPADAATIERRKRERKAFEASPEMIKRIEDLRKKREELRK